MLVINYQHILFDSYWPYIVEVNKKRERLNNALFVYIIRSHNHHP